MTEEKKTLEEEKPICPICLIELKDKVDWQKFFLIISGYDDLQLNELLLRSDKANEIIKKEVERRASIKSYEAQPPPQQQPFLPPTIQEQHPSQAFPANLPNVKHIAENIILKKWINKLCPFCQKQNWVINEQLFQLVQWQQGNIVIGGGAKVQPIVSIICRNCGYTTIINAVISGTIRPQPKPPG